MRKLIVLPAGCAALPACAHTLGHASGAGLPLHWSAQPWVIACLGMSLGWYVGGLLRLRRRAGRGRPQRMRECGWFAGGWLVLVAALVSPLDPLGEVLFSAHMVQHELLMLVAAPLLVLGRPFGVWIWALPQAWRQGVATTIRWPAIGMPWGLLTRPLPAWLFHALVLWIWHVPAFFEAALASDGVHTLQHLSFLVSALFFWWSTIGAGGPGHRPAVAMLSLLTTMMHTGALGALLTFSTRLWYPVYLAAQARTGFDALADQQLGGLIMWVPGGVAYIIAALVLGTRWLAQAPPPCGPAARPSK